MSLKQRLSVEQSYVWHPGQEGLKGCISMPNTHITLTNARYHMHTVIFMAHMPSDSLIWVLMPEQLLLYFNRILFCVCVFVCLFWQWLNIQLCVCFQGTFLSGCLMIFCVSLWQVIADTNISAIASQVESMSSSSTLSANPETPITEPEWVLRLSASHTPLFTGKTHSSSTTYLPSTSWVKTLFVLHKQ